ncbi:hypothetical protein [Streptomyces sp. NPDC048252]|uniref:LexA family protein n=1 Tax=Streptomyces sp. NPDC048252 TaxID=3154612 RepID=UPI003449DC77
MRWSGSGDPAAAASDSARGEAPRAVRLSIRDRGEALSVRKVARGLGLRSPASVTYRLVNLQERGALVRDCRSWQTCRLTR